MPGRATNFILLLLLRLPLVAPCPSWSCPCCSSPPCSCCTSGASSLALKRWSLSGVGGGRHLANIVKCCAVWCPRSRLQSLDLHLRNWGTEEGPAQEQNRRQAERERQMKFQPNFVSLQEKYYLISLPRPAWSYIYC